MSLKDQLNAIQQKVYNHFTYKSDQENYGTIEKWVMPADCYTGTTGIVGDCEDFALACRKLCSDANIKTRLVVCVVNGEGHCVLESNGWIFDCNYDSIRSRDDLTDSGYVWKYISGFEPGEAWHRIAN
jgi:predicted transglutaminase-like cysteine proteinase